MGLWYEMAMLTSGKSTKGGDEAEAHGDEDRLRKQGLCSLQSDGFGGIEQQPHSTYLPEITEMMETGCFLHGGKMRDNRHELQELPQERFRLATRKA